MDLKELKTLIDTKEGQKLEFKKQPSNLAKEMVAFSNSSGGKILVGVDDSGDITGLNNINEKKSKIQDFARNCDPSVQIDMETIDDVIVVKVKENNRAHKAPDGFYLRQGPNSQKLDQKEIAEVMHEKGEIVFDEMICNDFTYPQDFDKKVFEEFLEMADITKNLDDEQLLLNLGVAKKSDELEFTNAGVLMFAKNPKKFYIQAEVICGAYESDEKTEINDREVIEAPLLSSIRKAEQFVLENTEKNIVIDGLERKKFPEIPREALREAIVNAAMHRDYHGRKESVQIDVFPKRVVVRNPGGLMKGMRKKDLGTKSMRRNPNLANLLDKVGFAERMGTGINRMEKAMREADLANPTFETNSHFQVSLQRKTQKEVVKFSGANLNGRQKEALKVAYREGSINNSRYREINKVHRQTAKRELRDMVSKGILEKRGKTRGTFYTP